MRKLRIGFFTLLIGLSLVNLCAQSVPPLVNYQGRLANPDGTPFPTADYELSVRLYDAPSAGRLLWGPQLFGDFGVGPGRGPRIPVIQGHFNLMLGPADTNGMSLADVFTNTACFVEVTVSNRAPIQSRQQILSTPFAIQANSARVAQTLAKSYVEAELLSDLGRTVLGAVLHRRRFTTDDIWIAPANLSSPVIFLWGCGGGGGGAGGGGDPFPGANTGIGGGGGGGGGAAPVFRTLTVVPGTAYRIEVGRGGAGGAGGSASGNGTSGANGSDGGTTTFEGGMAVFMGAWAGLGGDVGRTDGSARGGAGGPSNGAGGEGGSGESGGSGGVTFGRNSPYAPGGRLGVRPSGNSSGGLGGGGGGGFGEGGRGGSAPAGSVGGDGVPGFDESSAGGGGGGGGAGGFRGGRGGDGGSGFLEVLWFAPR